VFFPLAGPHGDRLNFKIKYPEGCLRPNGTLKNMYDLFFELFYFLNSIIKIFYDYIKTYFYNKLINKFNQFNIPSNLNLSSVTFSYGYYQPKKRPEPIENCTLCRGFAEITHDVKGPFNVGISVNLKF
jgi:hypothetical protein